MPDAITALILDLDGTLIDSKSAILESFEAAVQTVFPGRRMDLSAVVLGPPIRHMFERSFPEAAETELEGLLRAFRATYDREAPVKTPLYHGVMEALSHFQKRGVSLHIATNKPLRISTAILSRLKAEHYFRSIMASDSVQPPFASKSEILRRVLQTSGLRASEAVYVGDSTEDARAGAECRLRFVWAAYGYGRLEEPDAKSVFKTLHKAEELIDLLE